jgi:murein DD-endopeptidase MepM/ murein hydrolase activator NlpD
MRVDGNSAYDKKGEEKRKWNYRYTMIGIICVLIVGAAALIAFENNPQWRARGDNNIDLTQEDDNNQIGGGGINVVQPVPTIDSRDTPAEPKSEARSNNGITFPVKEGKVTVGFSGNGLVYSKTLDQYVVHQGIDIQAPLDSQVMAVADGTVTKVYNDDKLGITIELKHKDNYVSRYSNLSTDRMVEEGDVVKSGDIISGVGITALFESMDSPHLHFEVWKDGNPIDPAKFIEM